MATLPAAPIKQKAVSLGFDLCRIIPPGEAPHFDFFKAWIQAGCAADMTYLQRNLDRRQKPERLASSNQGRFRSLIVLAVDYHQPEPPVEILADSSRGIVAAYARSEDYHDLIQPRLHALDDFVARQSGRALPGKCLVDSGPVLERDWAQLAGIGFTGKNCCTIHPTLGSWLLLATVLVQEEIEPDRTQPLERITLEPSRVMDGLPVDEEFGRWTIPSSDENGGETVGTCGRCSRCMAACPTDAFRGPYLLDARRCISYWTIEARGSIPSELRPMFGNRIFGCDACQDVCPWNKRLKPRTPLIAGLRARTDQTAPPLLEGFAPDHPFWLEDEAFAARFARTPLLRPGRRGMLRNVCVALGNWGSPEALPALARALDDSDAVVRVQAAWAVGEVLRKNMGAKSAVDLLERRLKSESDSVVIEEIYLALG